MWITVAHKSVFERYDNEWAGPIVVILCKLPLSFQLFTLCLDDIEYVECVVFVTHTIFVLLQCFTVVEQYLQVLLYDPVFMIELLDGPLIWWVGLSLFRLTAVVYELVEVKVLQLLVIRLRQYRCTWLGWSTENHWVCSIRVIRQNAILLIQVIDTIKIIYDVLTFGKCFW